MRLTLTILGIELDISLSPVATDTDTTDEGSALNGGTLASTEHVGFTSVLMDTGSVQWDYPEDHGRR